MEPRCRSAQGCNNVGGGDGNDGVGDEEIPTGASDGERRRNQSGEEVTELYSVGTHLNRIAAGDENHDSSNNDEGERVDPELHGAPNSSHPANINKQVKEKLYLIPSRCVTTAAGDDEVEDGGDGDDESGDMAATELHGPPRTHPGNKQAQSKIYS
ncbi:unnamed protein product [Urochloa humidicola]